MDVTKSQLEAVLSTLMSNENGNPKPHSSYFIFGSSVTCNPPVQDTDIDVGLWGVTEKELLDIGAFADRGSYPDSPFISWRWGNDVYVDAATAAEILFPETFRTVNLVQFTDAQLYQDHLRAAGLCKFLNLRDREDRIAVFDAIRNEECDYIYSEIPEHKIPKGVFSWLNSL